MIWWYKFGPAVNHHLQAAPSVVVERRPPSKPRCPNLPGCVRVALCPNGFKRNARGCISRTCKCGKPNKLPTCALSGVYTNYNRPVVAEKWRWDAKTHYNKTNCDDLLFQFLLQLIFQLSAKCQIVLLSRIAFMASKQMPMAVSATLVNVVSDTNKHLRICLSKPNKSRTVEQITQGSTQWD